MATTLSVLLKMTDQVSDKFREISQSGQSAVDALKGIEDTANGAFDSVNSGTREAASAMQEATGAASGLNNELAAMNGSTADAGDVTADYADAAADAAEAMDDSADATKEAAESVEEYSEETEQSTKKTEEWKDKSVDAANAVATVIAAAGIAKLVQEITDAFAECTEAARQFETSSAMLTTIAGKENIAGLKTEIAALSKESGAAQKDLAGVAYNAISAGTAVEDSVEMAHQASMLAAAGFTDEDSALRVLTTAINSYGDAAGTAAEISDSLIMVQNLGVTTVADLAQQMGKSISTAAAYNVSLGNLESAYISTTKAGIATAESTTYISGMIAELGKEGTDVAKTLTDQTGKSFGQLMNDGNSLADVLGILYEEAGRDTEAFANMWGSQTAAKAALAIVNQGLGEFNKNLETVQTSVGATQQAFDIMADTGAIVDKKLNNAAENLKIAIGDDLLPVVNDAKEKGTEVLNALTEYVEENPEVVAAVASITGAVTVFTSVLVGFIGVTKLAALAVEAFSAASIGLTGGIGLAVAAIAGLVAGAVLLHDTLKANMEQEEDYTYSTRVAAEKIEELTQKYDAAVEKYGATSEEALRLKNQIDDLSASYEANKQTVDQVISSSEALRGEIEQSINSYKEEQEAIARSNEKSLLMAQRLKDLAQYGHGTNAEYAEMQLLIDQLNAEYEDYNETLSRVMSTAGNSTKQVLDLAQAEADRRTQQSKMEAYVDNLVLQNEAIEKQKELEQDLKLAQDELNQAAEDYDHMFNLINADGTNMFAGLSMYFSEEQANLELAQEKYDAINEELQAQNQAVQDVTTAVNEQRSAFEEVGQAAQSASEVEISSQEQAANAVDQVAEALQEQAEELAAAYQKAHEEIRSAINGTFGLFDEVKTESETTTDKMIEGLQSQGKYLDDYKNNIETVKNAGLSDALVTALADGSKESAENLQVIVDKLSELGEGSQEAKDLINTLNEEFAKVVESKQILEDTLVQMNDTLKQKTDELVETMTTAVDNMDLSEEAATNAKATLEAYAQNIATEGQSAVTAAQEVAAQVAEALSKAKQDLEELKSVANEANNVSSGIKQKTDSKGRAYEAAGTTYSPDTFIAGEAGAELITNRLGSEVFPASETAKIIRAVKEYDDVPEMPTEVRESTTTEQIQTITTRSTKDVNLNINGQGLSMGGGVSMDAVETFLSENIRPVLLNLLTQEAMEEGDVAYEY